MAILKYVIGLLAAGVIVFCFVDGVPLDGIAALLTCGPVVVWAFSPDKTEE